MLPPATGRSRLTARASRAARRCTMRRTMNSTTSSETSGVLSWRKTTTRYWNSLTSVTRMSRKLKMSEIRIAD